MGSLYISDICCISDGISNNLLYELEMSDVFDTSDGSSLDADCTREYSSSAADKTDVMTSQLADAMAELCGEDTASVLTYKSAFASFGNQVACA